MEGLERGELEIQSTNKIPLLWFVRHAEGWPSPRPSVCQMTGRIKCKDEKKKKKKKKKNVPRPSVKFERLLIGYISKCKDRLSISIVASISQP